MLNKLITHLKNATKENKKILLIGNRSIDKELGETIDSYDIVMRFNFSPLMIERGELDKDIYGTKVDIVFLNELVQLAVLGKYDSKISSRFKISDMIEYKEYLENSKNLLKVHIVNSGTYSYNVFDNFSEKKYYAAKQGMDNYNKIKEKYSLPEYKNPCPFTFGTNIIFLLIRNGIEFDVCGFNFTDYTYDRVYYKMYSNIGKIEHPQKKESLWSHDTNSEREMLDILRKKNCFNVIDYPESGSIFRKNGLIVLENIISKTELKNFSKDEFDYEKFIKVATDIFKTTDVEISTYNELRKDSTIFRSKSENNLLCFFIVPLNNTITISFIPESHFSEYSKKVFLRKVKVGNVLVFDSRLDLNMLSETSTLRFAIGVKDRYSLDFETSKKHNLTQNAPVINNTERRKVHVSPIIGEDTVVKKIDKIDTNNKIKINKQHVTEDKIKKKRIALRR